MPKTSEEDDVPEMRSPVGSKDPTTSEPVPEVQVQGVEHQEDIMTDVTPSYDEFYSQSMGYKVVAYRKKKKKIKELVLEYFPSYEDARAFFDDYTDNEKYIKAYGKKITVEIWQRSPALELSWERVALTVVIP